MAVASRYVEIALKSHEISSGKPQVNVYHYDSGVAPTDGTTQAQLGAQFNITVTGIIIAATCDDVLYDEITVRNFNDPLDPGEIIPIAVPGAIVTDMLPFFNAVTVQLRTAVRGRSYKGSKHHSGVPEADTTLNRLNAGALARWQPVRDVDKAPLPGVGANVWAAALNSPTAAAKMVPPVALVVTPILSATLNLTIGTMKRRKEKTAT